MPSCRIVIPVYRPLTTAELGVVQHNLSMLPDVPAALVGGHGQQALLSDLAATLSGRDRAAVEVALFEDAFFRGVEGYNRLLVDAVFYRRFADMSHVLICQHDALLLGPELEPWLDAGYDFVGAPNFRGYHAPERPLRFLTSLNGGLSLRNVAAALAVLRDMIPVRRGSFARAAERTGLVGLGNAVLSALGARRLMVQRAGLNEDVFWSEAVPAVFPAFRVPTPEIAAGFAFETCPRDLLALSGRLPFGCHAFLRYDPEFWVEHVPANLSPVLAACVADAQAVT